MKTILSILILAAVLAQASTPPTQSVLQVKSTKAVTDSITVPAGLSVTIDAGATITNNGTATGFSSDINTLLDTLTTTRGAILYRGASGWLPLAPADAGYSLTSNGSGMDPSYQMSPINVSGNTAVTGATPGGVLYSDGSTLRQYGVVPSSQGGTGSNDNVGVLSFDANTSITGGGAMGLNGNSLTLTGDFVADISDNNSLSIGPGKIKLGAFTATVGATGTLATLNAAATFTSCSFSVSSVGTLNSVGSTPAQLMTYRNNAAATSSLNQLSPSVVWQGSGWKTNATATSQTVSFWAYVQPITSAAAPYGVWTLKQNVNGLTATTLTGGLEYSAGVSGASSYGNLTVRGSTSAHNYSWNVGSDNTSVELRFNGAQRAIWSPTGVTILTTGAPAANPAVGSVILFVDPADNVLKARGSSGTVTSLANP